MALHAMDAKRLTVRRDFGVPMSKSTFTTWSRLTRTALAAHGHKLSYGQSMEVLAAGLGHNTYASFRPQDENALQQARFIVLSFDAMQRRAFGLGKEINTQHCDSVLAEINSDFSEDPLSWLVQRLERTDSIPRPSVDFSRHPEVVALAEAEGLVFDGVTTLWAECLQPFSNESRTWVWTVVGQVHASSKPDDFEIPFSAEVVFEKCGKHLMSAGSVLGISPRGRPSLVDDGIFDGYVSGLDD